MKLSSAAVALLASLPAATLVQGQCVTGGFALEFAGACTPEAVVSAYEDQIFNAQGGTSASCAISAEADLTAKLTAAGLTVQSVCESMYDNQEKIPFTDASKRGTDMHFESMFFNGRTDWQEEVETVFETEDRTRTSILKEDAEQVRVFFDGIAQGRRVEWPGSLPNFQSSVTDADGLATCTTNAAMCCWPKDRQANDNNGNCATPYDENCVNKDPADNTNLCYVDVDRGNQSTGLDTTGFVGFPGDNNNGEGAIHCHGLAWSNDVDHHTARYKANNLFFVSMYDHMYQRGYVKNIPGAPMCGCVEQMPTVSRSDCTQVDLTETIEIRYNPDQAAPFKAKLVSVDVNFNACQGINNRNNDLWAYIARLYYEGHVTPKQFGEAGRIITDKGCDEATKYELNKKSLTPGYDHDVSMWTNVAGREAMKLHDGYGHKAMNLSLRPSTADPANTHYGIIYRICQPCVRTHMKIYYRRRTPIPEGFSLITNILYHANNGAGQNVWGVDFSLHSTYEDAVNDVNPWLCPNGVFDYGATFTGNCSPDGTRVNDQHSRFNDYWQKHDVAYYVNKPEDEGLEIVSTTAIMGRDYAGGVALKDPLEGTIYMTGSGRDIWDRNDDFNYMSEPVDGDHTVIVHVDSVSSPAFHGWSKSGIMFRSSLEPGSPNYFVFLTGSNGVCVQSRPSVGSTQGHGCVNVGATSAWLKIEKRIETYTSFVGSQEVAGGPITWTVLHKRSIPGIGESYNVGLAVSSVSWMANEVTFSNYVTDAYYFPSAAPSYSSAPSIFVPSTDVGAVGVPGSSSMTASGSYIVKGSGSDIWGGADQFHFVHFTRSGDLVVEMLINSFSYVHSWQKGGIMFRETLNANSKHTTLMLSGNNGIANQWRDATGAGSGNMHNSALKAMPVWLQVRKQADMFYMSYKYPGDATWTALWQKHMILSTSFYVGIAVTSHDNTKLTTMEVGELTIEPIPPARNLRKA